MAKKKSIPPHEILGRVVAVEINVAGIVEKVEAIHSKQEESCKEIKALRATKHEHNKMLHTHAGLLTGISSSVDKLINSTNESATKTEENTVAMRDIERNMRDVEQKLSLGLQAVKIFFKGIGVLMSVATGAIIWIASLLAKHYGWW